MGMGVCVHFFLAPGSFGMAHLDSDSKKELSIHCIRNRFGAAFFFAMHWPLT